MCDPPGGAALRGAADLSGAADRSGQAGFVQRLITRGTIEKRMDELKSRKQALVAEILGNDRALAIAERAIDALFAPLPGSRLGSGALGG